MAPNGNSAGFGLDRREFLAAAATLLTATACGESTAPAPPDDPRLRARPTLDAVLSLGAGTHRVTHSETEIVAYVPADAAGRSDIPVMLFLHGALRTVEVFVDAMRPLADKHGVVVVAPYAFQGTWDAIRSSFGVDVRGIDNALNWVFAHVPTSRVGISGFSDGATYALATGRANGDLFGHISAYSPGFNMNVTQRGKPNIAVSHGTADAVLPFTNTRDVIVPWLRGQGYDVEFKPFDGPHAVVQAHVEATMQLIGSIVQSSQ